MKKKLGRGLEALIKPVDFKPVDEKQSDTKSENFVNEVQTKLIFPNRYQPRRHFDLEKLAELRDSILENGIIQPLIVTQQDDEHYAENYTHGEIATAIFGTRQSYYARSPNSEKKLRKRLPKKVSRCVPAQSLVKSSATVAEADNGWEKSVLSGLRLRNFRFSYRFVFRQLV